MKQETRNAIYGVGAGLATLLVVAGVIDQTNASVALGLFDNGLEVTGSLIWLGTNVLAFVKSLRSKVTVVEVPKSEVESVNTTRGVVDVAGRAA